MRSFKLTLFAGFILAAQGLFAKDGWINLFNGKNLSGWTQKAGDAKFYVEDGCIVGEAVSESETNSVLATTKDYDNFILELDFKADHQLFSGVHIRSEYAAKDIEEDRDDFHLHIPAGHVYGYLVLIDPSPNHRWWTATLFDQRWWSAGIYDELRRYWLYPGSLGGDPDEFSKQGKQIFNTNGWNHLRIEAAGDSMKTYLNGVFCAHINDSMTPNGFIGLQVRDWISDDDHESLEGAKVRFKNIRLKTVSARPPETNPPPNTLTETEKKDGWRLLWDGETADGWRGATSEEFPKEGWQIKDGVLAVLAGSPGVRPGDIVTRERFTNFELLVDFKCTPGCNSGIKYFVHTRVPSVAKTGQTNSLGRVLGYEYQILDDARNPDANLGHDGDRKLGSLYDLLPASQNKPVNPVGEWNTARIVVNGNHIQHWLNGKKILDYYHNSPQFKKACAQSKFNAVPQWAAWTEGRILLQEHGGDVFFRNIKIHVWSAK